MSGFSYLGKPGVGIRTWHDIQKNGPVRQNIQLAVRYRGMLVADALFNRVQFRKAAVHDQGPRQPGRNVHQWKTTV